MRNPVRLSLFGSLPAVLLFGIVGCAGVDPSLGWMEGRWELGSGYEVWTRSGPDRLVAEHVEVDADTGAERVTERLVVEIGPETTTLTPVLLDGNGNPAQPPVAFTLTELGRRTAVFTNPEHGTPHTIGYRRGPGDSTTAWILSRTAAGAEERMEFGEF